jgi:hypothetical protein
MMIFSVESVHAGGEEGAAPYVAPVSPPVAGSYENYEFLFIGLALLVGLALVYFIIIRPLLKRKARSGTSATQENASGHTEAKNKVVKPAPLKTKGKIFLSYRRNDSADVSGRIYDRLAARFGEENLFKDVDSIPLGADFREYIDAMIKESAVVLVVIGNDWLGRSGSDPAQKRIDDPRDFVRLEVAVALQRNVNIIPLLVRRAQMPGEEELPEELKPLAYRNGISIRPDPDFNNDIDRLMYGVQQIISAT